MDGAALYLNEGSFDLRNTAVAWNRGAVAVRADTATVTAAYDAWWENTGGNAEGFSPSDEVAAAPGFVGYASDGDASDDSFALWRSSALVDAGDPALLDPDGSRSDIGVFGGEWFVPEDADGDGATTSTDCDDADGDKRPGATDTWYDGIDSDCDGASDFDQDRDGLDAEPYGGTDCDDTDAAVGACADDDTDTDTETDTDADTDTAAETDAGGAGNNDTDDAAPRAEGCGCSSAPAAGTGGAWVGLLAAAVLLARRPRAGASSRAAV